MRKYPWWFWVSLLPAFGAWAPLIPAIALRRRLWIALGALWTAILIVGLFMQEGTDARGGVLVLAWIGGAATCATIRPAWLEASDSDWSGATRRARERLERREAAVKLVRDDPALARELGIGRPDIPGARTGGVIDVNHASATAIRRLPGLEHDLARRIVAVRDEIDGFDSLEDMGGVLDLDARTVERLRDHVVFLPR